MHGAAQRPFAFGFSMTLPRPPAGLALDALRVLRQALAGPAADLPQERCDRNAGAARRGQRRARAWRAIRDGLVADDRALVLRACQDLVDLLVTGYRVPPIRVRVLAQRPADDYGELHGLYEPEEGRTPARITVWMRTAARRNVVAFKTFLRTLIHEVCHHLDYELYELPETFHTEGFYKRESTLTAALLAQANERGGRAPAADIPQR